MKILFDQGTPVPLRHALHGHDVATAYEMGWQELENGALLAAAEASSFDAILTTDKNIRHQQNLAGRNLAILVLSTTDWRRIGRHAGVVVAALEAVAIGDITDIVIPDA